MSKTIRLLATLLVLVSVMFVMAAPAVADEGCCPRSPGYWKNHPDEWPVESLTLGGVTYTKAEAIEMMNSSGGDKRITMFRALAATALNLYSGCECSDICDTANAADEWLTEFGGSRVSGSSDAWKCGEQLYWCLDAYNNGMFL